MAETNKLKLDVVYPDGTFDLILTKLFALVKHRALQTLFPLKGTGYAMGMQSIDTLKTETQSSLLCIDAQCRCEWDARGC